MLVILNYIIHQLPLRQYSVIPQMLTMEYQQLGYLAEERYLAADCFGINIDKEFADTLENKHHRTGSIGGAH